MTVTIKPGEGVKAEQLPKRGTSAGNRLGLAVHPLTDAERRKSDLPQGLMVESASGAAAKAGIQPGDIVLGVNDGLVESQEELTTLTSGPARRSPCWFSATVHATSCPSI